MKRWLWLLPVFLLLASAFFGWNADTPKKSKDIAIVKKPTSPAKTRKPASIPKKEAKLVKQKEKRQWIGNKEEMISNGQVKFTNKPTTLWNEKLMSSLKRGLPTETRVKIQPERSLVMINAGKATNTEQVIVVFEAPGKRNSYRAMVDSQSGKIIRTWDHTIHENMRRPSSLKGLPLEVDPD